MSALLEARKQGLADLRGALNIVQGRLDAYDESSVPLHDDTAAWITHLSITRQTLHELIRKQEALVSAAE